MVALIPFAGLQAVWSADEGALLFQIESLAGGAANSDSDGKDTAADDTISPDTASPDTASRDGWTFRHPIPAADPTGRSFPIHLSSWAVASPGTADANCAATADGCRYIVLAKHVAFLWVATGLFSIGGYGLLILISTLAGLATAIATARLASLVEPAAEKPALWITGLASPVLMHSYVAWGHTVAAALIGWATYWLLADRQPSPSARSKPFSYRSTGPGLGLFLLFLACLVRTEAPLAGLAIGLALLPRRRRIASAAIATSVVGVVVDRLIATPTGGPVEPAASETELGVLGFLAGRIEAFTITWLQPAYGSHPIDMLILAAAACVVTAGVLARRGPSANQSAQLLLVAALAAVLARFAVAPAALVPGLFAAFPVLFAGLLLVDRATLTEERIGELLAGFALFCGAVLATQYRQGGGGEWGGRYFAVGLPLGISVAVVALTRAASQFERADRRRTGGLLAATMVVMSTMGVVGLRTVRNETEQLAADIGAAVEQIDADDRPVVLSSIPGLGRWMWDDLDQGRWLRVPQDDLPTTARRLRELGVDQLAFVSQRPNEELELLKPWFSVDLGHGGSDPEASFDSDTSVFVLQPSPD
ncbi:MAG: hypothetical protein ACRBK7_33180 [Acidimicrobiales bacterium]